MSPRMSFARGAAAAAEDTRTSTIVVAASNSLDPTLAPAAYRCSGVADDVEMNAALVAAAAVNGSVELLEGDYNTVLTLSVAVNVTLKAVGWGAVINFNAGGNAVTIAGDNVKLRDFKVVIVAGAGGAGTRPNAVYATGRTNVEITKLWLYGDQTEADDASHVRQCGIVFTDNMAYSKIAFCTINNFQLHGISFVGTSGNEVIHVEVEGDICYSNGPFSSGIRLEHGLNCTVVGNTCQGNNDGISFSNSDDNTVTGNTCQGATQRGIFVGANSNNNTVTGNTCQGNEIGISVTPEDNTVVGNTCQGNSTNGIAISSGADNCTVVGNTCQGNTQNGINIASNTGCTVTGNTCPGNTQNGIRLDSTVTYCTVSGNTCSQNVRHGILLDDACLNNTIVGNTCNENDVDNTNTYDGICIEDDCDYNLVMCNTCNDNDRWGISLGIAAGSCVGNWVKNNHLRGNTSGPYTQVNVTDTKLATIPIPLVQGTTFISAAGEAWGWEIDADTEFALGIGWLPLEVQQVVRIRIIGVALADPGAGNEMRAQFTGEAATFHEPFATNPIDVVDKDCEETDPDIGDVIHWVLTATDDADIANIVGGDRLQLKVLYEDPENGSIATDAIIDTIQVEYV